MTDVTSTGVETVPGPTPAEMGRRYRQIRRNPVAYLEEMAGEHGGRVAFPVPGTPALLLSDPADIDHVLRGNSRGWTKDTVQFSALERITGPGLLASSESSWITHRRVAAPAFHHERLVAVGEQVRAAARSALHTALPAPAGESSQGPSTVDLAPVLHGIALDAVGRALFGTDLSGEAADLLEASSRAAALIVALGSALVPLPRWAPSPTNVRIALTRRRLDAIASDLVDRRRTATAGSPNGSGSDLLGLLIDSGMDDGAIRDELITMVVAGHETVAAALSWTLMLLAEHPAEQDAVRAELLAAGDGVTMLDHRERLPRTRAVIDESLRLFPPAWVVSRRAAAPDTLNGLEVPAGTLAIISPWVVHRRPELWPDPLRFDPSRFADARGQVPGYVPFGLGPRLCIGREFALGEMTLVLAELLTRHRVDTPPGWHRPEPDVLVAVHPAGGMRLRVTPLGAPRP